MNTPHKLKVGRWVVIGEKLKNGQCLALPAANEKESASYWMVAPNGGYTFPSAKAAARAISDAREDNAPKMCRAKKGLCQYLVETSDAPGHGVSTHDIYLLTKWNIEQYQEILDSALGEERT